LFIKSKKSIVIISSVILLLILGGYGVYEFLIPALTSSPRPSEERKMRKELYNIEKIILLNKNNNEAEMDISEFRKLIPYVKCEKLLISKGNKIEGNLKFKDDNNGTISIDEMYGSFRYTYEGEQKGFFYYFKGDKKEQILNLVAETITR